MPASPKPDKGSALAARRAARAARNAAKRDERRKAAQEARKLARATATRYWPRKAIPLVGKRKRSASRKALSHPKRISCRNVVIDRDGQCCVACGAWLERAACQVHEHPPRSLGGDPHAPEDCVLLCPACHTGPFGIHGAALPRLTMAWGSDFAKAFGPVVFTLGAQTWTRPARRAVE